MSTRTCTIISPVVVGIVFVFMGTALPTEARDRGGNLREESFGWGPSVGRNASKVIGSGLAEQGTSWLDTMANFYADPRIKNREYFDYYRRPYYGSPPTQRRR